MIWMLVSLRICTNGKWQRLHAALHRCTGLTMSWKREPRSYQKLRAMVNDILEHQHQNMFISRKARSRHSQHQRTLQKEQRKKRKDCCSCTSKSSCSTGGKCSFEHDPAKTWKAWGLRSWSLVLRDNSDERQYAERRWKVVLLIKKIVLRVLATKKKILVRYLPHCKYLKTENMSNGKGFSVHPLAKARSINRSSTKRKKAKKNCWKTKGNGCHCEYSKSPSQDCFR